MSQPVIIRYAGNLLEVDPPLERILGPVLTYQHRSPVRNPHVIKKTGRYVKIVPTPLYRVENGKLYCLAGLLDRVMRVLRETGFDPVLDSLVPAFPFEPDYEALATRMPNIEWRESQPEVLGQIIENRYTQIDAPAGWGKSFLIRCLACLYPKANIIVTEPWITLAMSMYNDLLAYLPDVGIIGGGKCRHGRVTVCVAKSLKRANIDKCDIFLYDEAHTAGSADSARDISCVRDAGKIVGFSASPEGRSDGASLVVEALFGPIRYRVTTEEAVASGAVVPVKVHMLCLDRDSVPEKNKTDDLFSPIAKKRAAIWTNKARTKLLAEAAKNADAFTGIPDTQVLVLAQTLGHALELWSHLPGYALVYGSGSNKDIPAYKGAGILPADYEPLTNKARAQLGEDFKSGKLRKAVATGVWGTGMDFKQLGLLVYASGEPGEITIIQWGGRVTRTNTAGKVEGHIVDCNDAFDGWAKRRAQKRMREYRSLKWRVIHTPTSLGGLNGKK